MFTVRAATAPSDIPAGTYTGSLLSVTETPITSQYGTKDMWRWTFLLDVNGEGKELDGLTGQSLDPEKSKAFTWLSALLKRAPAIGDTFGLSDVVGKRVLVTVGANAKGYPKILSLQPFSEAEQVVPGIPR